MTATFGDLLKAQRHRRGLTQTQLARQLDLASENHISKLENGRMLPSLQLLLRLADTLQVSVDVLLGLEPEPALLPALHEQGMIYTAISHPVEPEAPRLFGAKLQALRQQVGWSQVQLAQKLGMQSQAHVSRLEAGTKLPSLTVIISSARLFGVSAEQLLRDTVPVDVLKGILPGPT